MKSLLHFFYVFLYSVTISVIATPIPAAGDGYQMVEYDAFGMITTILDATGNPYGIVKTPEGTYKVAKTIMLQSEVVTYAFHTISDDGKVEGLKIQFRNFKKFLVPTELAEARFSYCSAANKYDYALRKGLEIIARRKEYSEAFDKYYHNQELTEAAIQTAYNKIIPSDSILPEIREPPVISDVGVGSAQQHLDMTTKPGELQFSNTDTTYLSRPYLYNEII